MVQSAHTPGKRRHGVLAALFALVAGAFALAPAGIAAEGEKPVERTYTRAPNAPRNQSEAQVAAKTEGCQTCHAYSGHSDNDPAGMPKDSVSMHASPAVRLGCTDCHGGNVASVKPAGSRPGDAAYDRARDAAHVLPRYPKSWHFPHSANPELSFTLLNREAPEFIRFVNPSDYRVARESCGACHMDTIHAAERSMMATGVMLWGGAAYNNGILPFKNYINGEAYSRDGRPAALVSPGNADRSFTCDASQPLPTVTPQQAARGNLPFLCPLPRWQVIPPGDNFRVFERGGRNIVTQFPEVGLPNSLGLIQRLEEPGRPDIRQSNRGLATGLRVSIPVLNIHKTRLNDPFMWFMGTNEQPGDYRTSGCGGCHVPYANDRDPKHSLIYAAFGRDGQTQTTDPTIPKDERGHPLRHAFTRSIPSATCMNCHMHQPNMFMNTYYGYTMWDYESDANLMWPEKQAYPSTEHIREVNKRNPEGAAPRGLWSDPDFLRNVYDDVNPRATAGQFADYHGHGWNFRAIFKRNRHGDLLDADGNIVPPTDPEKFLKTEFRRDGKALFAGLSPRANPDDETGPDAHKGQPGKAVHLMSIHAEVGMQCADCHFAQDSHGNGMIQGEVTNAVEIGCKDCHGTADSYPSLRTSGVAARPNGTDLSLLRNPDGQRRFEWLERDGRRVLVQRSIMSPNVEWVVSLVKDSVNPASPRYNPKAARAKLVSRVDPASGDYRWNLNVGKADRAHGDDSMTCYTCHLSWTTSCGGCHLPIEANWKSDTQHYEGEETRNYATYNPQVARDEMFQLGRHQTTRGNIIAPVRSSSALVLSSTNINRERIYVQQPPISAGGYSSQAFAPHFPHTERKTETKTCTDCHLSADGDNNAIMSQLLLLGTNFVNFMGLHAYVGEDQQLEAIRVTEWEEPQAVFGSYLHKYAYPDFYRMHVENNRRELKNWVRGGQFAWAQAVFTDQTNPPEFITNTTQGAPDAVNCLQLRGEYLYAAAGTGGFRVYDVASIANKGISDRFLTAPFAPPGQDVHVRSANATCVALPTNQPVSPIRNREVRTSPHPLLAGNKNEEQEMHAIYSYAAFTDAREGLILVNVETMVDREPTNNFLRREVTFNPEGKLTGARHITLAGHIAYVVTDRSLVVVDLDKPKTPVITAEIPLQDPRATAVQFRYLWVTTARGLEVFDVTTLTAPKPVNAIVPIRDARRVYVARTYAYVAAGADGLVIVDVERPEQPGRPVSYTFDGRLTDARDVVVASTNASLFAYVADGWNGFKVLQLTSPESQPNLYGFSPKPVPELIAWRKTDRAALAVSKGIDRDRAVDETGGQIAVFGRLGSRPFTRPEMEMFFRPKRDRSKMFYVTDRIAPGQDHESARLR